MKRNFFLLITLTALAALSLAGCEKTDKYIHWKVMNDTWFQTHKTDSGFSLTSSGLAYKRIGPQAYESERKPNANEQVTVKYSGSYINGYVFESSSSSPWTLTDIISGLKEGVLLMRRGETYQFYIPQQLGYGNKTGIAIPPYSTLIFTVTLLDSKAY